MGQKKEKVNFLNFYVSHPVMYRNIGGGKFSPVTVGLEGIAKGRFAAWGDFNGDKKPDVVVGTTSGSDLYENNGATFARNPAIHDDNPGTAGTWLGVNFLSGTEAGTRYYRYDKIKKVYEEAATKAGLFDPGEAAAFAVWDEAGRRHIYDANKTMANRYWLETSAGSDTFESMEGKNGTKGSGVSTSATWVPFQEGKRPALFVTTYDGKNHFFVDKGTGEFEDLAAKLGLGGASGVTSAAWGDFAGYKRPFPFLGRSTEKAPEANQCYVPQLAGDGSVVKYTDRALPLGMATTAMTTGAGVLDYDGNKKLDLVVVSFKRGEKGAMEGGMELFRNESFTIKTCPGG